jgi:hypothetical protein
MPSTFAEYLDKEVRTAIDYLRLVSKVRDCIHHSKYLHYALHTIKIPQGLPHGGEQKSTGRARKLVCFLNREISSDFANRDRPILTVGPFASKEQ